MAKVKRSDIQGIRGLAIASVLAFHLNEKQFPSGFVGVDIFFVLSGFLMSSILAREREINLSVLVKFYTRRFKRIVPLYIILILCLFILVPLILLEKDVMKFLSDAIWAVTFSTNIHSIVEQTDYFAEIFDSNVLTHTWSLGVEIQYYLIVPLIISCQRFLGERLTIPYFSSLIIASFSFQCYSSTQMSFNGLPSRVWQFIAGGMAYELMSFHSEHSGERMDEGKLYSHVPIAEANPLLMDEVTNDDTGIRFKSSIASTYWKNRFPAALNVIMAVTLIFISLACEAIMHDKLLRAVAIMLTSIILVLGNSEKFQPLVLINRPIVYLGDISYVVYLVHWPVIIIWKSYFDLPELPIRDTVYILGITFTISIFIHHTLEQLFISATTTVSLIVVSAIYLLMLWAVIFNIPQTINKSVESHFPINQIVAEAMKWNEHESHTSYFRNRPFPECENDPEGIKMRDGFTKQPQYECVWKPKRDSGTIRILVVGNSISHRATKILYPILKNNNDVKEMRLFAQSACRPIEGNCLTFFDAMMKLVRKMKPDITFLIFDDSRRLSQPIHDIETDKPVAEFVEFLKPLKENSKYLVLDEFYPGAHTAVAASMFKRLLRKQSLEDLKGRYEDFLKSHSLYFRRMNKLSSFYPDLIRHNTSGLLCSEQPGWCWWYNRKNLHAYFTDNVHLSADGLELERESYNRIIKDLIRKVKKNS